LGIWSYTTDSLDASAIRAPKAEKYFRDKNIPIGIFL
jgi:hypothetical protein